MVPDESATENVRKAVAYDILSERTLRYKRNMFLSATFATIHVIGKIDSNTFTLSGAEFHLPHADSIVGITILLTLLYFTTVFHRYAKGDLLVWETRFTEEENQTLAKCPDLDESYFNNYARQHGQALHREYHSKLRFFKLLEFYGPLLLSMVTWLALLINMINNVCTSLLQ